MRSLVHVDRQSHLLQVVETLRSPSSFAHTLHCRQQHADQHTNDRNNDEELDERKSKFSFHWRGVGGNVDDLKFPDDYRLTPGLGFYKN